MDHTPGQQQCKPQSLKPLAGATTAISPRSQPWEWVGELQEGKPIAPSWAGGGGGWGGVVVVLPDPELGTSPYF